MKRSTSPVAEEKNYPQLPLFKKPVEIETDKAGFRRYQLGEGVFLDIIEGEESDFGCLNIYGVVIKLSYREIKKGEKAGTVFASYPQYTVGKGKNAEYKPYVTNYSKPLNDMINEAIKMNYE